MSENKNMPKWETKASQKAIDLTQGEVMLKLVVTIDANQYPHTTMISSSRIKSEDIAVWGQFTTGSSKDNVFKNQKQGIFYMTAEIPFKFTEVKADFIECKTEGEDLEIFNKASLFRYNTYMRVYRAFYNKIKAIQPVQDLSLLGIVKGLLINLVAKKKMRTGKIESKVPKFGLELFGGYFFPKYISYIDPKDGYPVTIICFQARVNEGRQVIFNLAQFRPDLEQIPVNSKVSVFAINMETASAQIKGRFLGYEKVRGFTFGRIEIDEVYNGIPPLFGQIYPKLSDRPKVESFNK